MKKKCAHNWVVASSPNPNYYDFVLPPHKNVWRACTKCLLAKVLSGFQFPKNHTYYGVTYYYPKFKKHFTHYYKSIKR